MLFNCLTRLFEVISFGGTQKLKLWVSKCKQLQNIIFNLFRLLIGPFFRLITCTFVHTKLVIEYELTIRIVLYYEICKLYYFS